MTVGFEAVLDKRGWRCLVDHTLKSTDACQNNSFHFPHKSLPFSQDSSDCYPLFVFPVLQSYLNKAQNTSDLNCAVVLHSGKTYFFVGPSHYFVAEKGDLLFSKVLNWFRLKKVYFSFEFDT